MKYLPTQRMPLHAPEVVLNLWAYTGDGGYVLRIAGKAYAMDGEDDQKLALLHALSSTDFLCAAWEKVPQNLTVVGADGEKMAGVAHASMLSDPASHQVLFGPLMERLASELPTQMRSFDGEYAQFRLELPEDPLCVTTIVIEHEDGRLEPMIAPRT